jgi:photosystem II stability/assembly factor-like uncharacterized protein
LQIQVFHLKTIQKITAGNLMSLFYSGRRSRPQMFWWGLLAFLCGCFAELQQISAQSLTAEKEPVFSPEPRLQWHQQHLQMLSDSPFRQLNWKHIGPEHMSGRITDIVRPLDRPFTIYVTSASGGIWKTENEGTEWQPLFDNAPSAAWGAIAVDPQNSNTIWAGGGESNIFRSSMSGTGIYRSDDAGISWTHLGLADTHHIARIIVHPGDSRTVWVAAGGHEWTANSERGIFKTTDGGQTWRKVLYESDLVGANDLVLNPQNPDEIYATMWYRIRKKWNDPVPGPGGGIYKSTDGGESWRKLSNGLPPRDTSGRIGISLAASNPQIIYALIDNHEIGRKAQPGELDNYGRPRKDVIKGAEIYRSEDGGMNWKLVSRKSEELERLFSTYGWVFSQIRVDPSDENTVYAMGINLLKSTDGGGTFQTLNYPGLHADHHAMWIDPSNSNYIINGNDGGVNLSYDGGKSWKEIINLPVVQFYNVEVDNRVPFNVYGSVQDNFSWVGPSNYVVGRSNPYLWKRAPGGEASYHAIDPNDQDTIYSTMFYGSIQRSNLATRETVSIMPRLDGDQPPLRGQWLAPLQLSRHNSQVVYHGMNRLFRSMNRGETWEVISHDLTYNDPEKQGNISYQTLSTLSESPLKFGLIYAGTDDGRLWVTQDGGTQWEEVSQGLSPNKWFSRVVASRFEQGAVYATQNGKRDNDFQVYVARSRDYGQQWEDISAGIPGGPVNVIREDPRSPEVLYVGTDLGVYVTTDGAKSWNVLGSGLPVSFVHDIAIQERDLVLVVATHGRGIFTIDISSISPGEKN